MAAFDDVLKELRGWGEEAPPPVEKFDVLSSEFQALVDQRDGATALIAQKDEAISAKDAEIARLKIENYEFAVRAGGPGKNDPNSGEKQGNEDKRPSGIAGLFQRKKV